MSAKPLVMGVVNVTPDSFSDGGRYAELAVSLDHALRLIDQGAAILDVGGESTRPGASPVPEADEIGRVTPLIAAIRSRSDIAISIDTMKPAVARAAVAAGATIWNDVSALTFAPDGADTAAELGCEVVLMHMRGQPQTMQSDPRYADVVGEVQTYLAGRAAAAEAAGVAPSAIWLDPGIGFGKSLTHNLQLLADLGRLTRGPYRVLLGVSRKSFIKTIDPSAADPNDRLGGSLAGALAGADAGVAAVRVHDVRATVQALEVWSRITGAGRA